MSRVKLMRDYRGNVVAIPTDQFLLQGKDPGFGTQNPDIALREMFERLPDADVHGAVGLGNTHFGEQDRVAQLANHRQDLLPPPPYVYKPLSALSENNRGQGQTIQIGGTDTSAGTKDTMLGSVINTGTKTGDDAESIIVTLGLEYINQGDPGFLDTPICIDALLEWGVGGTNFHAECDWRLGAMFVLPACFVKVAARWDRRFGDPLVRVRLAASVTYGTPSSGKTSSPIRKTVLLGDLDAGGVESMPIPLWANNFVVTDATVGAPDYTIEILESMASVIAVYSQTSDSNLGGQNENTFAIPNCGRFIRVTNNLGIPVTGVRVIFNLAI